MWSFFVSLFVDIALILISDEHVIIVLLITSKHVEHKQIIYISNLMDIEILIIYIYSIYYLYPTFSPVDR